MRRALDQDRDERPTAKELYAYFAKIVSPEVRRPEVRYARLVTPLCVRGMDARVEWQIQDAEALTLTAAGAGPQTVDLSTHPDGFTISKPEPGPVFIEVKNKFGTLRIDLGEIALYELPEFRPFKVGTLPRPGVPHMEAFTLGHMRPVLEAVPQVGAPEMPAVPPLPTAWPHRAPQRCPRAGQCAVLAVAAPQRSSHRGVAPGREHADRHGVKAGA